MTPRRIKEEIREKEQDLESFQQQLKQIKELDDQLTSQGKKSKGKISI